MSDIHAELLAAQARRQPVALAIIVDSARSVPRRPGAKMLVYVDGTTSGTVGGGEMEARTIAECLDALTVGKPRRLSYALVDPTSGDPGVCGGEVEIYVEPYMPQRTLFVIGAGHVGAAVAHLATWLGHRVVVWDDREGIAETIDDLDDAVVLGGSLAQALETEPIDEHTQVVMVTRNVALDVEILPHVLATKSPYIGLMGSNRRWETTRAQLVEAGHSDEELDRVVSPIGLEIHAETPAEIAVSIMAEIIGTANDG